MAAAAGLVQRQARGGTRTATRRESLLQLTIPPTLLALVAPAALTWSVPVVVPWWIPLLTVPSGLLVPYLVCTRQHAWTWCLRIHLVLAGMGAEGIVLSRIPGLYEQIRQESSTSEIGTGFLLFVLLSVLAAALFPWLLVDAFREDGR